ncbi:hypothetical protein TRSC58_04583 [Trypanosoma rangeli SC58]|uniref:Uncharacterized protein n=1 Tax=Trypanosoma rangeli SC58 TaxID=429131 RepID=A0A061IYG4_TRYRA|nr:hypothetical protein TRSC58_04583 [Trypanosoma rangeli SC58]
MSFLKKYFVHIDAFVVLIFFFVTCVALHTYLVGRNDYAIVMASHCGACLSPLDELQFLNECLVDALAVHLLISHALVSSTSAGDGQTWYCSLLEEDVQLYLRQLLRKYTSSSAMRKKLTSARSLYYLQCLTDEKTREEFVRVAAHPSFADTI